MNEACDPKRQSVARNIVNLLDRVQELACQVSGLAQEKLAPIIISCPAKPGDDCDRAQEEYPELFHEYRQRIEVIETHLRTIEVSLQRAEV